MRDPCNFKSKVGPAKSFELYFSTVSANNSFCLFSDCFRLSNKNNKNNEKMIDWKNIELADVEQISSNEDTAEQYFNLLVNVRNPLFLIIINLYLFYEFILGRSLLYLWF